jgi:hypothetical protein
VLHASLPTSGEKVCMYRPTGSPEIWFTFSVTEPAHAIAAFVLPGAIRALLLKRYMSHPL